MIKSKLSFVLALWALSTSHLFAQTQLRIGSSPNPTGSGAHAMGMGNAFIAVADDATAASWNPAGLMQIENIEFSFAYEFFTREGELDGGSNHPESDSSRSISLSELNYASLVIPKSRLKTNHEDLLDQWRLAFSLNFLKQFRYDQEFNFRFTPTSVTSEAISRSDWRHDFDQDGAFSTFSPTIAFQVTSRLALGLTVNIWDHDITRSSSFETSERTTGTNTDTRLDNGTTSTSKIDFIQENEFTVDEGYSFVIGFRYLVHTLPFLEKYRDQFEDKITLGFVAKPNFDLKLDRKQLVFDTIANTLPVAREFSSKLEMSSVIGVGVQYKPNEKLILTSDVTWTDWSSHELRERNRQGKNERRNPITALLSSESKLSDTFTARMGIERHFPITTTIRPRKSREKIHKFIPVSLGFAYDPVPAVGGPDDVYNVSAGAGFVIGKYDKFGNTIGIKQLNIAWEFRFGNSVYAFETFNPTEGRTEFQEDIRQHRIMISWIQRFR